MNEVLTLIGATVRDVFCRLQSVTQSEFYNAAASYFKPELVFVLTDYLDYEGERLVKHEGEYYSVIRTYRKGQELEIVVQRASAEEVEEYGEGHQAE